jgi:hypothetical protein
MDSKSMLPPLNGATYNIWVNQKIVFLRISDFLDQVHEPIFQYIRYIIISYT